MNRLVPAVLLLHAATGFAATTVYKTVNESGVVSFSDTNPQGVAEAEILTIATPPVQSTEDYRANLEAMRETTDRMAQDRREREKHRAELKNIAENSRAEPQPAYYDSSAIVSGGGYYYPSGRPPWRPGYPALPEHPIIRPPLLPGSDASVFHGANSQLMRPMLSNGR